jgi:hypothetical protein
MKARAIGILCLISGVLAVPLEQAQNSQQVEPQQAAPAEAAEPFFPGFPEDSEFDAAVPEEGEGEDEGEGDAEGEGEGDEEFDPEMMMMETGNVDMEAFEQMVNEVQGQVEAISKYPPLSSRPKYNRPILTPSQTSSSRSTAPTPRA